MPLLTADLTATCVLNKQKKKEYKEKKPCAHGFCWGSEATFFLTGLSRLGAGNCVKSNLLLPQKIALTVPLSPTFRAIFLSLRMLSFSLNKARISKLTQLGGDDRVWNVLV